MLQKFNRSQQLYLQLFQSGTWGLSGELQWWYLLSYLGSWSSIDAAKNNTVIAFNYNKGDIITVDYDPAECKLVFRKKGTEEVYTIEFEAKDDDELYLCGLFYYNNDEIEFIGYDEE